MSLNARPGIIINRKIAWLLLFSLFSLAMASWVIYINKKNIEQSGSRINQTHEVIGSIQQILTLVAESGFDSYRYLVSGDREAAIRLRASHDKLQDDLALLGRLTREPDALTPGSQGRQRNILILQAYMLEKRSFENSLFSPRAPTPGNTAAPVNPGTVANSPVIANSNELAAATHLAALNNKIRSLLDTLMQDETTTLAVRKHLNGLANRRAAYGLVMGRIIGFLFVVILLLQLNKDMLRRKKVEERLVGAIREAQEAKLLQEQFLANMSHEIRTPMNGIKGMTDLLQGTRLSEKQLELTGMIKSSVNNLLVIINDILDFSKIKAGKLNIEKIDFSIKEILNGAAAIFEQRLKKKELLLQVDIDPAVPDRLNGDPHRLNQVLTNLLGNAIKFTREGSIHIRVDLQERSDDGIVLAFSIADTGMGIPAESLPFIFDSFSQAGHDISRRYGGTGLGLTICKQLLHLQNGDITATSQIGKGSAFNFYLPYGYSEQPAPERSATKLIHDYSNLLTGKHFLVAEDNEINQKLIDYVLKKAGGTVDLVSNGAEAIRFLRNERSVDLIIMDLQMPEMDGYEATQYIRNDLHMQTPIIAMTATAMKGEHFQCLESGMNEYMTKPFEFADLYKRIGNLLSSSPVQ